MSRWMKIVLLAMMAAPTPLWAGEPTTPADGAPKQPPKEERFVTQHSIRIGGQDVPYAATAGTLLLHDDAGEPTALIGYTAYVRTDAADPSRRPVAFAYNGGPGSSSIWLHMGALGPRRIVTADAAVTPPPPYRVVDNELSILDDTDLVLIDPVGTGVSRAVGAKKDQDFWGVDTDIASVSAFIKRWIGDNDRWNSPKLLIGESYGTTRSAGIVNYLQSTEHMTFNGVVLVSTALDIEAIFDDDWVGNDRPYPFLVPTFAAVAWYHHLLRDRPEQLGPFLDEVRRWALGPYATALLKGDALTPEERSAIAAQLAEYTGLSADYVERANLRVSVPRFTQELLREHREVVGRFDARFTGLAFDPLAEKAAYDPMESAVEGAFTSAFLDYYHRDLGFPRDRDYKVMVDAWKTWDWRHRVTGTTSALAQPIVNTTPDLARALGLNPDLRVLVLSGYYDLATPFASVEYCMSHLGLPADLAAHVHIAYYEAGHMMYLHEPALAAMKHDLAAFIASVTGGPPAAP